MYKNYETFYLCINNEPKESLLLFGNYMDHRIFISCFYGYLCIDNWKYVSYGL